MVSLVKPTKVSAKQVDIERESPQKVATIKRQRNCCQVVFFYLLLSLASLFSIVVKILC